MRALPDEILQILIQPRGFPETFEESLEYHADIVRKIMPKADQDVQQALLEMLMLFWQAGRDQDEMFKTKFYPFRENPLAK